MPPELFLEVLEAITTAATGQMPLAEDPQTAAGMGYEIAELLDAVERSGVADETRLLSIEWVWLAALDNTRRGSASLHRALTRDPRFFAEFVGLIFRSRSPEGESEERPPLDELTQRRAESGWRLLHDWRGFPGLQQDGSLDEDELSDWVGTAREACQSTGHSAVGDIQIGDVLSRSPIGADGNWPHEVVRRLIELSRSDDLEEGFCIGVVDRRGATWRLQDAGGESEQVLAQKYANWAESLACESPRTSRALRYLQDSYLGQAQREDEQRDLREFH